MCDYSLMHLPNRLAAEGEQLVAHRFESGSTGLASPFEVCACESIEIRDAQSFWQAIKKFFTEAGEHSVTAVCVPPGTRLLVYDIGEDLQREYELCSREEATFEQISAAAYTYRDAIRFDNGQVVRFQDLPEGQRVIVLELSGVQFEHVEANRTSSIEAPERATC
jgi:hypothetical protein